MIDPVAVDRELRGALLPLLAGTLGAGGILEAPVPVGELGRGLVAHSGGGLSGGPGFIEYSFLIYKPSSGPSASLASGPALVHGVCSLLELCLDPRPQPSNPAWRVGRRTVF